MHCFPNGLYPVKLNVSCFFSNGPANIGTGTIINNMGSPMALTCFHAIRTRVGKTVNYMSDRNHKTSKYSMDGDVQKFGVVTYIDEELDFAMVAPYPQLPLVLNMIHGCDRPLRLRRFWSSEDSAARLEYLLTIGVVMKGGVSSGMTRGKIIPNGFQENQFFVIGFDISPFSIPGDSGSIVFDDSNGDVLGLITEIVRGKFSSEQHGSYISRVLPIWSILDKIEDARGFSF